MVRKSELKEQIKTLEAKYRRLEDAAYRTLRYLEETRNDKMGRPLHNALDSNHFGVSPHAYLYHPETHEVAPKNKQWVLNHMSGEYHLEDRGTRYTLSTASETYWAS